MPSIEFENFIGVDKKSSPTDLRKEVATEITNLSITKTPGALVKDGAYSDISGSLVGSSLPTRASALVKVDQFTLTDPSDKDTYILHATDAQSRNNIFMGQYWDGSTFQDDWLEMSEHEGEYTAGASTGNSQVVVNSGDSDYAALSTTDNYYVGFVLTIDITADVKASAIVTDYTYDSGGGTKTFAVTTNSITGAASGDMFSLSRSKLFADGIGETQSGSPLRYGDIDQIDNKIRWKFRENVAIGMTGNTSQFPTQYNLWMGYIKKHVGDVDGSFDIEYDEVVLDVQNLLKPYVTESPTSGYQGVVLPSVGSTGSSLTTGSWKVYAAYIYDGYQIGPISDAYSITVSSGEELTIAYKLPWQGAYDSSNTDFIIAHPTDDIPTYYDPFLVSRRVTGIWFYVTIPGGSTKIRVAKRIIASASGQDITDGNLLIDGMNSDGQIASSNVVTLTADPSDNTYAQDVLQNNLRPNFKYMASLGTHILVAGIRNEDGDQENNDLIASIVDGDGVATPDSFGASNAINTGFYGSKTITGIHVIGDEGMDQSPKAKALIFTDDDYYVLNITSGSSFSYTLDNIGQQVGLLAPDSLVYAEGYIMGVSRNGFRIFTPQGTRIIGEGFKNDFDSLTTPSECVAQYFKDERIVLFHFKTDLKTFAVDMLSSDFRMFEYNYADDFLWLCSQRTGQLLALDESKIYQIGSGTDQDGTAITPIVGTKRFTSKDMEGGRRGEEMIFTEGYISYKSDTAVTLNFYLNNSTTAITWNDSSMLPAKTTEDDVKFNFPKGTRADEAKAEFTLNSTQASTNTVFQYNRMRFDAFTKRRI